MPNKPAGKPDVAAVDKEFGVDARIAVLPAKTQPHSDVELLAIIRMLLLSSSRTERRLIGLTLYQRRTLAHAAQAVALPGARARELIESLAQRAIHAERKVRSDERSTVLDKRKWRRKNG